MIDRRQLLLGALASSFVTAMPVTAQATDFRAKGARLAAASLGSEIEAIITRVLLKYEARPLTYATLRAMVDDVVEEVGRRSPPILCDRVTFEVSATPEDIRAGRIGIDVISNESRTAA